MLFDSQTPTDWQIGCKLNTKLHGNDKPVTHTCRVLFDIYITMSFLRSLSTSVTYIHLHLTLKRCLGVRKPGEAES